MMVNSTDGSYIWGKYYQNKAKNATDYLGLFYGCKFVSDQKLIISGQVNFFKPFVGTMNAADGNFIEGTLFASDQPKQVVGYASSALEMDRNGNIVAAISFITSALSIVKLKTGKEISSD